jgi:hypothetical protein
MKSVFYRHFFIKNLPLLLIILSNTIKRGINTFLLLSQLEKQVFNKKLQTIICNACLRQRRKLYETVFVSYRRNLSEETKSKP